MNSITKPKNRKILFISILAIVFFSVAYFIYVNHGTLSYDNAFAYCQENSKRGAKEFYLIGGGSGIDGYFHFIALDGDENAGQELFIFKRKKHFVSVALGRESRYTLYAHAFDKEVPMGKLQITLRNDYGIKDDGDTLYFFGSNTGKEKSIVLMTCKYVGVDENGKTVKEYELDRPWYEEDDRLYWSSYNNIRGLEYFLVGTDENGVKWSVKDVKFMDKDGNVVFEYN